MLCARHCRVFQLSLLTCRGIDSLFINISSIELETSMHQHFDDELVLIWSLAYGGTVPEATLESAVYGAEVRAQRDDAELSAIR